jgi:GWxTD domain-containing protein
MKRGECRIRSAARPLVFFLLLCAPGLLAATLPDLFQKVKLRVAAGDYAGGLQTLAELDAEAAKPENAPARQALRPAAAFYRGVCLAATGKAEEARDQFAVYLAANPDKKLERNAYPKPVLEAFEQARKSSRAAVSEEISSLAAAYRQMNFPRADMAPPGPDWANGPVKYLLTPEEARTYSRIAGDAERAEFVARFWGAGDPASPAGEKLRREFERRAAFADEHLSEGTTRGSLTERGMVFLLMGPPSGVVRRPISASEDAPSTLTMNSAQNPPPRAPIGLSPSDQPSNWREVWRYKRDLLPVEAPYQQVDFAFQTRVDYGTHVLQREAAVLRTLDLARTRWRSGDFKLPEGDARK